MSTENEEVYRRLGQLEKEVFLVSDIVKEIRNERVIARIVALEEVTKQVKEDVGSIETSSREIAEEVKAQKSTIRGFLGAATVLFGLVQAWPIIKEILRGAVQ